MSFWEELKRRNVVKVGMAYAIAAWLIVHPVDIIFPTLHLPEWTTTFVTALFIIGFPFVLIFAWVYEVTPKGLKRTKKVPRAESITQLTGKKLNYIITGLLIVAVAYIVIDKFYIDRRATETKQVPAVSEEVKAKKTIAILPFTDLSPEKDQEYFVDGLSEELLNTFTKIPGLNVIARTSSFSFKDSDKTIQEIANILGADHILEGSVRKAGNALRITTQLIRAADGIHIWSETYDRELKDIFTVQEDIATAVANELKATLGIGKSLKQMGGTDNEKAYELYLIAEGNPAVTHTNMNSALESIDAAIKLDPEFALAWAMKAGIHQKRIMLMPADKVELEQDAVIHAAQKAIELEPNLPDGYFVLGQLRSGMGDWIEAELALSEARERVTDPSLLYKVEYAFLYLFVGHFARAKEIIEAGLKNDPLGPRFPYIICLSLMGDMEKAEEQYILSKALGEDPMLKVATTIARLGSGNLVSRDDIINSDPINDAANEHLGSPKEGLAELHKLYSDGNRSVADLCNISLWAAYFGDPVFAMDALERSIALGGAGSIYVVWFPVMKDVRQLPSFKEYIKKIGLVDYWNKFGWPDICRPLDNGDFVCD